MTTRLITAPTSEPVTLAEAKLQCKVDITADDALIGSLITAAREQAEHLTGRSLMPQTWEKVLDDFPHREIELLYPAIIGITSIKYVDPVITYDEDGEPVETIVTLPANQYVLDKDSEPGFVYPADDTGWPNTKVAPSAVRIRYQAGYADAAAVPASIKSWILMAVKTWYDQREAVVVGLSVSPLPRDFFASLLDRCKVWSL